MKLGIFICDEVQQHLQPNSKDDKQQTREHQGERKGTGTTKKRLTSDCGKNNPAIKIINSLPVQNHPKIVCKLV